MPPRGTSKKVAVGPKIPLKTGAPRATRARVAQPLAVASGSGSVEVPQIAPDTSPPITPPPMQRVAVFPTGDYVLPRLRNESPGENFGTMTDSDDDLGILVHVTPPILVSPIRARKPKAGSVSINRLTDAQASKLADSDIIGVFLSFLLLLLF